jgi:hypothetical protein
VNLSVFARNQLCAKMIQHCQIFHLLKIFFVCRQIWRNKKNKEWGANIKKERKKEKRTKSRVKKLLT